MNLNGNERRIFTAYEEQRELAEVGLHGEVECIACSTEIGGEPVVLLGVSYCDDCGSDEAFRLRATGDEWSALTRADQVEVLEVIETAAHAERAYLVKKGGK